MKHRTAVLSAVFPGVMPYHHSLIDSLANQTEKNFDWVVINDGVDKEVLARSIQNGFSWVNLELTGLSPAQNRWAGIKHCLEEGYDYIIFQDADDWMSANRIENAVALLKKAPVVFHDLSLVDEAGLHLHSQIWSSRFKNNPWIGSEFLQDKNCIGLGNAAVLSSIVRGDLHIPENIIAVDWYLFFEILQQHKALFSPDASVLYRQYQNNTAGIGILSKEKIERTIQVKEQHYIALVEIFPELEKERQKLACFKETVFAFPEQLLQYIQKNQSKAYSSFWWEETNYSL